MKTTVKFLYSTLVAAAAMTSTAYAWDPATNDYTIGSLDEFKAFRDYVNGSETQAANSLKGKTVTLTADIDLASEEWTPIGNSTNMFKGTFDGNGHTISNLVITGDNSNVGLFGYTTDGAVKNFTLNNAKVSGYLNVGAVAGTPYTSKYSNITLTGTVQVSGFSYVGGVAGKNAYADWTDIHVNVSEGSLVAAKSVTENGTAYRTYVGGVIGFVGEGNHTLKDISSNINVVGSTCDVGGIVGIAHYGNKLVNVTCTAGLIKVESDDAEVGAIAGVWYNGNGYTVTFENCTVGEGTTVIKTYEVDGEKVKESLDGAGALYGSAYFANGTGVLNLSASGMKQYTYDATIGSGVSEVYGQVVVGDSGLYGEASQDDGVKHATLTVKGTLTASDSSKYFWVGGEYGGATDVDSAETRFSVVVDGGMLKAKNEGINLRPDGALSVINGGRVNASYIVAEASEISVAGENSSIVLDSNGILLVRGSELNVSDNAVVEFRASSNCLPNLNISNGSVVVESGATLKGTGSFANSKPSINIGAEGSLTVNGGNVDFATIVNNGAFTVVGNSTVKFNTLTSAGEIIYLGKADGERSKISLGSVDGVATITYDKANQKSASVYAYNSDVSLSSDLIYDNNSGNYANAYLYFNNSTLDLGDGKTLKLKGGKLITRGLVITGKGTFVIEDSTHSPCWQESGNIIGKDVTLLSNTAANFYGDTTIYGTVNFALNTGNSDLVGSTYAGFEESATAKLTISGGNYTTKNGFVVTTKTNELNVVDAGTVLINKTLVNNGVVTVGAGSTLTANEITGEGDVVLAGTINVVGGVFTADDLTIVAGATLNFGAAEKGVTLMATREVISFDFNTLTIIATNVKAGELDLSQVITDGNGADALLAALAGMEEAPEFTVIDSNTGKTFTAVYSSENGGTVSVIPEPSMFGLLAGLGALLLVGTRRRRK